MIGLGERISAIYRVYRLKEALSRWQVHRLPENRRRASQFCSG